VSDEASYPEDLLYHPEHDWARVEGERATLGITWYAQDQLGEVVFFELPAVGSTVTKDSAYAEVESVKADELVLLHLASGVRQAARLASPGGENPGTGPQTVQAVADSVAPASGTDARSVSSVNDSTSPSEEPAQRVRRPHRIRRQVESTD